MSLLTVEEYAHKIKHHIELGEPKWTRYGDVPAFITTDSIFHVYHLVFDKMLRDLERDIFIPMLRELTSSLIAANKAQYDQLVGTPLEEAALRNLAFFSVAGSLLQTGDPVPDEARELADAELALIMATSGVEYSPIFNYEGQPADMCYIEDYSQYIPRGHYTLGPELEMYFRAMMWYGRMNYRLKDSMEVQRALLITKALRENTTPPFYLLLRTLFVWRSVLFRKQSKLQAVQKRWKWENPFI